MKTIVFSALLLVLAGCASTSSSEKLAKAQQDALKFASEMSSISIKHEFAFRSCVKRYAAGNYKKSSDFAVASAAVAACQSDLDSYKYFRNNYYSSFYSSQSRSLAELERVGAMAEERTRIDASDLERAGMQLALQKIIEIKGDLQGVSP